jgi:hypothetical protein
MTKMQPAAAPRARRKAPRVVGWSAAVAAALLGAWWWQQRKERLPADVARWVAASPFRNVRPGVKYVGDAACAQCHPIQCDSFHQHPMGRSFFPTSQDDGLERYGRAAHNPFEALGLQFSVERTPQGVIHKAVRNDAQGRPVVEASADVAYVMGSGTRGRSYLIDRGGYLFQSPVSWFTQKHAWDLSPKFETFYPPERVVEVSCLFCHANDAAWVPPSRNHYKEPVFTSYAIGCERCHGPGALHVASRARGDEPAGADPTIVNPRHLSPALREAVCQQCHLQGEQRVARWDRNPFDYRPGLPIHLFWSVFVRAPGAAGAHKAVGQVEQMYASRCFRASDGKLGCSSCHDPHMQPTVAERPAYFRDRCLSCHQEASCSLPVAERRKQHPDDSCAACHMPRLPSANIAHTAVTDHRILRRPDNPGPADESWMKAGAMPLVNFFDKELDRNDPAVQRDLGVALVHLAGQAPPLRPFLGQAALPLLESGLRAAPDDAVAWESKGFLLAMQGKGGAAQSALEAALRAAPTREVTLSLAAQLAEKTDRPDQAIDYWRRAAEVNPWVWEYRFHLAQLLARRRQWPEAWTAAEAALRLSPLHEPTRTLFITCSLAAGKKDQADQEFAKLVALNPANADRLRAWYAEQAPR